MYVCFRPKALIDMDPKRYIPAWVGAKNGPADSWDRGRGVRVLGQWRSKGYLIKNGLSIRNTNVS